MPLSIEIPDLECELLALWEQIPIGKVATCGAMAGALGSPFAAKWIGHYALHHRHDSECLCHRVVRARGELGGYVTGDMKEKIARLKREGVEICGESIDLARFGFEEFDCASPLARLRTVQEELVKKIAIRPRKRLPKLIGGVDAAYPASGDGQAAFALVEVETGQLVWSHIIRRPVRFPYITSFLSFREMPILVDLIEEVRELGKMPEVLLVDGTGVLHPRHAGLASHLGVIADVPTIGVTKKLLCGQVDIEGMKTLESRPILFEESLLGLAMRTTSGSLRPIFLSAGHRVDLTFAESAVRQTLFGRRLPEPLYWADRLSKKRI
jgi:deoxyribonuclease V